MLLSNLFENFENLYSKFSSRWNHKRSQTIFVIPFGSIQHFQNLMDRAEWVESYVSSYWLKNTHGNEKGKRFTTACFRSTEDIPLCETKGNRFALDISQFDVIGTFQAFEGSTRYWKLREKFAVEMWLLKKGVWCRRRKRLLVTAGCVR